LYFNQKFLAVADITIIGTTAILASHWVGASSIDSTQDLFSGALRLVGTKIFSVLEVYPWNFLRFRPDWQSNGKKA